MTALMWDILAISDQFASPCCAASGTMPVALLAVLARRQPHGKGSLVVTSHEAKWSEARTVGVVAHHFGLPSALELGSDRTPTAFAERGERCSVLQVLGPWHLMDR
jgi:hypothetical protein